MTNGQPLTIPPTAFTIPINSHEIEGVLFGSPIDWIYSATHPYFMELFPEGNISGGVNAIFLEHPSQYYILVSRIINSHLVKLDKDNDAKLSLGD